MPCELNARFCMTAVKLYVQSERILTSFVNPCLIRVYLIIIDILCLFKWDVYVGTCNKNYTEAGDIPAYGGKKDWLPDCWTFTNKQTKGLVRLKYSAVWRSVYIYIYIYIYIYMCVCVCARVCVYIYIHITQFRSILLHPVQLYWIEYS